MAEIDVFISYSRKDSEIIYPILEKLREKGYKIWIDTEGKYHSEKFRGKIVKAIIECKCVLFFSSKNSNASEYVRREINVADEEHKPIIPFILDDTGYDDEIRLTLTGVERIDTNEMTMEKSVNTLIDTLSRIIKVEASEKKNNIRKESKLKRFLLLSLIVFTVFVCIYFVCFGLGYAIERFSNKSNDNQQVELNLHISYSPDVISYSNHGLKADYYVSKDTVIISKDSLYYSLKSEDFWRAASISLGFSLWAKNLKNLPGNGKTKVGIAVASFFGMLFGYSQGKYFGEIHNKQATQDLMENYLQDPDNWVYLKQSYRKRSNLFNE